MMSDPYTAVNLQPDSPDQMFHKSIGFVSHANGMFALLQQTADSAKVEVKKIKKYPSVPEYH